MDNMINIKSNWKHSLLEYKIKKFDTSQDMSRAAVFEREVRAAEGVKNWKEIQASLSNLEKEYDIPVFTSLQAKYDDETAKILKIVREGILEQLEDTGLKVLRTQYLVLLLQVNYYEILKKENLSIKIGNAITESDIDLTEIPKMLFEMMLNDRDCMELRAIRKILVEWKNK